MIRNRTHEWHGPIDIARYVPDMNSGLVLFFYSLLAYLPLLLLPSTITLPSISPFPPPFSNFISISLLHPCITPSCKLASSWDQLIQFASSMEISHLISSFILRKRDDYVLAEPINAPFSIESAAHSVSRIPLYLPMLTLFQHSPLLLFGVFSFHSSIENLLIFFPNASFHSSSRAHFVASSCSIRSIVLLLRVLWPIQNAESITLLALSTAYRSPPHSFFLSHLRSFTVPTIILSLGGSSND